MDANRDVSGSTYFALKFRQECEWHPPVIKSNSPKREPESGRANLPAESSAMTKKVNPPSET